MSYEAIPGTPPTVEELSKRLRLMLSGFDCGRSYFQDLTAQMKTSASVSDTGTMRRVFDRLSRNLVVAADGTSSRYVEHVLGSSLDRILTLGLEVTGTQIDPATDKLDILRTLQTGWNIDVTSVAHDSDPAARLRLLDYLMDANTVFLTNGAIRAAVTQKADTQYYCGNIADAALSLDSY